MGIGEKEERYRMLTPIETLYQSLLNNYSNIKLKKYIERNLGHIDSRNPNIIEGLNYYFKNR